MMGKGRTALPFLGWLVVGWGIGGIVLLLVQACVRLSPVAYEAFTTPLAWWQLALGAGWVAFSGYAEGHRGFHKQFAPRVVARGLHLARYGRWWQKVFAAPYCMSLYHSTRRGLTRAWVLLIAIVGLVVVVRSLPQPYRGLIDAGVVVGLCWGLASIVWHFSRALRYDPGPPSDVPTDVASVPSPAR